MNYSILGPSHAVQIKKAISESKIAKVEGLLQVNGYQSIPIFCEQILNDAIKMSKNSDIFYLYVTNTSRFNFFYKHFLDDFLHLIPERTYAEVLLKNPSLTKKSLLYKQKIITIVENHKLRWLKLYSNLFPNLRFIFWCDYCLSQRQKINGSAHWMGLA